MTRWTAPEPVRPTPIVRRSRPFLWVQPLRSFALIAAAATSLLQSTSASDMAKPGLEMTSLERVAVRRVTRTQCDVELRGTLTNRGPAIGGAVATGVAWPRRLAIVDGELSFGPVPAKSRVASRDTFSLRQDCGFRHDPDALLKDLRWRIKPFQASVVDLQPARLTVVGSGGVGTLTVTIQNPEPAAMPMSLQSSDPTTVEVPEAVVVPAGSTAASFTVTGNRVGGPVAIKAKLNGTSATAFVTVRERPVPPNLVEPLVEGATLVSGTGIASALVQVFIDGVDAGALTAGPDGRFVMAVVPLRAGQMVTATQTLHELTSDPSAPVLVRARPPAPRIASPLIAGSTQVRGTGVVDATVNVFVDDTGVATVFVDAAGAFVADVPVLVAGQRITATQTVVSVTSIPSASVTVVAVPPVPIVMAPLVEGTNDVFGTGLPGATVNLFIDNVSAGTAAVGEASTWSVRVTQPLTAGQVVNARQLVADVSSALSQSVTVVARPPAPMVNGPLIQGATTVTGTGIVGAAVDVFVADVRVGSSVVGGEGAWDALVERPLVAGDQVRAVQTVGGIASPASDPVTVVARPPAPVVSAPLIAGDTVVGGTGLADATVVVFADSVTIGTARVSGATTWSVALDAALAVGQIVTARQIAANIPSEPSAPVVVVSRPPAPTISEPLLAGATLVTGSGVPDATLEVFVDGASAGTTSVSADTTWGLPVAVPLVGGQVVRARQTVAGVSSPLSPPVIVRAALIRIDIQPAPTASIAVGGTLQFTARGTYASGQIEEPLPGVNWTSDNALVASIAANGVLTGNAAGTASIRATRDGVTSEATSVAVGTDNHPPQAVNDAFTVNGRDTEVTVLPGFQARLLVSGAPFGHILSVVADGAGHLYVGDDSNPLASVGRLFRVDLSARSISTLRDGLPLVQPDQLLIGDGRPLVGRDLILADHNTVETDGCCDGRVFTIRRDTGTATVIARGAGGTMNTTGDPFGIALGPGGAFGSYLYVMDFQGSSPNPPILYRLDDGGTASSFVFAPATWTVGQFPRHLAFPTTGAFGSYLYVSDGGDTPTIWRITPDGTLSVFLRGSAIGRPGAMRFSSGGAFGEALYFIDEGEAGHALLKRAFADGRVDTFGTVASDATDLAFAPDGHTLYVALPRSIVQILPGEDGDTLEVLPPGVLGNDHDPDGDGLTSALVAAPGHGALAFGTQGGFVYRPSVDFNGDDAFSYRASDGRADSAPATVRVTVIRPPRVNQPPSIAPADVLNATVGEPIGLGLAVSDDGLPSTGTLSTLWASIADPGVVSFSSPSTPESLVTFGAAGTYVLRLTASDSALASHEDVTVVVGPGHAQNTPPVADAGPDIIAGLLGSTTLGGSVSDDGLPAGGVVTSAWTKVSGPGLVTFGDAGQPATTAVFDRLGTYVLRLTASDSLLEASDTVIVSVQCPAGPYPMGVLAFCDQFNRPNGSIANGWDGQRHCVIRLRLGREPPDSRLNHRLDLDYYPELRRQRPPARQCL